MSKIFISSDHAGFNLKEFIKKKFIKKKRKIFDLGPDNSNSVDYPIYAHKLSKAVSKNSKNFAKNILKRIVFSAILQFCT